MSAASAFTAQDNADEADHGPERRRGAGLLLATLGVGFLISLFQSVTQIQEQTLSFVPKAVAAGAALLLGGNWMLHELVSYTEQIYAKIPTLLFGS